MIADSGIIIRTHVENISQFSRVSQGVRIMRLKNDAKITSVALAAKDEEEETSSETEQQPETEVENENTAENEVSNENEIDNSAYIKNDEDFE